MDVEEAAPSAGTLFKKRGAKKQSVTVKRKTQLDDDATDQDANSACTPCDDFVHWYWR